MKRLRELDFLRGIAIILVFFRHQYLFEFTHNMGWIGVDLFFVLSGFLVSGLLFKEYLKFGNIEPKRFLIRRGFKIYPIYYLTYPIYFGAMLYKDDFSIVGLLSDLTFTQNYFWGYGYAYSASWSLAVEEHFYFGFSIILWLGLRFNKIKLRLDDSNGLKRIEIYLIIVMAFCLILRLINNYYFPISAEQFTLTHFRIDSLLMGVLISYLFYFRKKYLQKIFQSNKKVLIAIAFLGIIWTPFIEPIPSFFAKTYGFSLLYVSFGILLLSFLFTENINLKLNIVFSSFVVNLISKIGYCSYSIYIIHLFVNGTTKHISLYFNLSFSHYFNFIFTSAISILVGMIMTYKIEKYFLTIRDKFYPGRVN